MKPSIDSLRSGNADAWRALIQQLSEELLAYAYRIVGDWATAQDVVQDALLALYQSRRQLRADSRLKGWCFRAVRNRARNHNRDASLRSLREQEAAMREQVERNELANEAWQATETLPEAEREVIDLRYRHGLMLGEVAEVLAIPEGTVSTRQRQGLEKLREKLQLSAAPAVVGLLESGTKLPSVPSGVVKTLEVVVMASIAKKSVSLLAVLLLLILLVAGGVVVVVHDFSLLPGNETPIVGSLDEGEPDSVPEPEAPNGNKADTEETHTASEEPQDHPDSATPDATPPVETPDAIKEIKLTVSGKLLFSSHTEITVQEIELFEDTRAVVANAKSVAYHEPTVIARTESDEDGLFVIQCVVRDRHAIDAGRMRFAVRCRMTREISGVACFEVKFPAGEAQVSRTGIDIPVKRPFSLRIEATDESGNPVEGAVCTVMNIEHGGVHRFPDGTVGQATTDDEGCASVLVPRLTIRGETNFTTPSIHTGTYCVVEKPGFSPVHSYELNLMSAHSILSVTLKRAAGISGRLLDSDGRPLAHQPFRVSFRREDNTGPWATIPSSASGECVTGGVGEFLLDSLFTHAFMVRFEMDGLSPGICRVGPAEGGREDIELHLYPKIQVRFSYVEESTDTALRVLRFELRDQTGEVIRDDNSLDETELVIENLDSGAHTLNLWFHGEPTPSFNHEFTLQPGESVVERINANITMAGKVAGRVIDKDGKAFPEVSVRLLVEGEDDPRERMYTDENGAFEFVMLERTTYTVTFWHVDAMYIEREMDVSANWDATGLEIELLPYIALTAEVDLRTAGDERHGPWRVEVTYGSGKTDSVWAFEEGRCTFHLREPGPVTARLRHEDWRSEYFEDDPYVKRFDPKPGEEIVCSFRDTLTGSISGTLKSKAGIPLTPYDLELVRVGPDITFEALMEKGMDYGPRGRMKCKEGQWRAEGILSGRYLLLLKRGEDDEYELLSDLQLKAVEHAPLDVVVE